MRKWIFEIVLAAVVLSPFCGVKNTVWAQDDDTIDIEDELDAEEGLEDQAEVKDPQLNVVEKPSTAEPAERAKPAERANSSDSPDLELEDRLFKIFSELKGPLDDKDWQVIVKSRKSEKYTIQRGDTLWDISRSFFGDPFFWPKIWSLNKDIYNPHFVVPKQNLKFFPGTLTQEPTIEIEEAPPAISAEVASTLTKEEKAILPEFGGETDEDLLPSEGLRAATVEDVIIPPTRRKVSAKLPVIPPSIPIWDVTSGGVKSSNLIFSGKPLSQPSEVIVPLASFIAEEFPESDGRIVRVNGAQVIGNNFQPIYVEVFGGKVGESLLVISKLKKPKKFYQKANGVPVSIDGQIKLVEAIDEDAELFRAIITANINPVVVGAQLIRQSFPKVELSLKGTMQNIEGEITGGFMDGQTEVFGSGYFVYLNVGASDGIKVGGLLSVLADEQLRDKNTIDNVNSREIGILKIVHVQDSVATGIIVASSEEILPGDFTGKPGPLLREQLKLTRKNGFRRDLLQELSDEDLINDDED